MVAPARPAAHRGLAFAWRALAIAAGALASASGCGMVPHQSVTARVLVAFAVIVAIGLVGSLVSIQSSRRVALGAPGGLPPPDRVSCLEAFEKLRFVDPEFSIALFEDFLTGLYLEAQRRKAQPTLALLDAHLASDVRVELASRAPPGTTTEGLRVGGLRYLRFSGLFDPDAKGVELEVELTLLDADLYQRESWVLRRSKQARTRRPSEISVDTCPSCGAPRQADDREGYCGFCDQRIDGGDLDWVVVRASVLETAAHPPRPPLSAHHTSLLTVRQEGIEAREAEVGVPALEKQAHAVLGALQAAWTGGDPAPLRPVMTDAALESTHYWLDALRVRREALPLGEMVLRGVELAAASIDRWFFEATVRVYAAVPHERVVARESILSYGAPAAYSAYWTFIRGNFVGRGGPPGDDACPWCGGPVRIVMEAICDHCGAVVDKRAFGWLLSRMEPDRAYTGEWIQASGYSPRAPDRREPDDPGRPT